jgi:hypothetical protein
MFDSTETATTVHQNTTEGTTADANIFSVSSNAHPCDANDFATIALGAINDLLDEAVLHDEMSGTRAWLVQHLVNAREVALDHSARTA